MCDVKLLKLLCMIYSNINGQKYYKSAFLLHVITFCEKQENCKAISGHFHYVNHKYTSSRRKHIWHLENIRNTITRDENSQREYFDRLKNQNLRKNILFLRLQKCSIHFLFDDKCFFLNTKFFTIIACPLPFFSSDKSYKFHLQYMIHA